MNAAPAISGSRVYPAGSEKARIEPARIEPARIELITQRAGEALVAWSQSHRTRRADVVAASLTPEAVGIRRAAQVEAQEARASRDAAGNRQLYQLIR